MHVKLGWLLGICMSGVRFNNENSSKNCVSMSWVGSKKMLEWKKIANKTKAWSVQLGKVKKFPIAEFLGFVISVKKCLIDLSNSMEKHKNHNIFQNYRLETSFIDHWKFYIVQDTLLSASTTMNVVWMCKFISKQDQCGNCFAFTKKLWTYRIHFHQLILWNRLSLAEWRNFHVNMVTGGNI